MVPGAEQLALHVCTFIATTGLVGVATWFICSRMTSSTGGAADDFFAGGRSLRWYVVAGSLMLTNLSTEQLVGLNGSVYKDQNLAGIWLEAGAAIAMIITATVFLPRYMSLGLTTTSGFLGERFDLFTRTMGSVLFLLYYVFVLCPIALYTGALAIRNIFDLQSLPLWSISAIIGTFGACYALFGGLKAVAVSDCLNGIGLLIVGIWVPAAALYQLGGVSDLFHAPEVLKPLVEHSVLAPWHVNFSGLFLTNVYYWSTNQVIVQRALAARSLADGQKGVLFAASMKVVGFIFLCLPGTIGLLLVRRNASISRNGEPFTVPKNDEVYPELVKAVMPLWSLGFFAAVLVGSVLSSFNSALNSAATIFGLEIYKVYINKDASDKRIVNVSTIFGAAMTLGSFVVAPLLQHIDGIFSFQQHVNTIVSLPLVVVFLVGVCSSIPDAFAAKFGFAVGVVAIIGGLFVPEEKLHYFHTFFIAFVLAELAVCMATYLPCLRRCFGAKVPRPEAHVHRLANLVEMSPWRPVKGLVVALMVVLALLIVSLQLGSEWLFYGFWVLWLAVLGVLLTWSVHRRSARAEKGSAKQAAASPKETMEEAANPMAQDDTVVGADYIKGIQEMPQTAAGSTRASI